MASNKGIQNKIDCSLDSKAWVDENMYSSILRNFLNNAIKFSYIDSCIDIKISLKGSYFELSVFYYGIGISVENLGKLFDLNIDYSTTGTQKEKGTGLGLIICKEFAELNIGYIKVESNQGKGSRFVIGVPALR